METYIHIYNRDHGIIYQGTPVISGEILRGRETRSSVLFFKLAAVMAVFGLILMSAYFLPPLIFSLNGGRTQDQNSVAIGETAKDALSEGPKILAGGSNKPVYEPRFDSRLPKEARIEIPSIGVDTQINEATIDNYEEALKKGVWRASDFSTPGNPGSPTILAAHRYGYIYWGWLYRRQNSFYNLPNLKVGDTIEIIWRQRKYVYEVYWEDKGSKILDYSADLILYTCESLNTPVRVFKYARLVKI